MSTKYEELMQRMKDDLSNHGRIYVAAHYAELVYGPFDKDRTAHRIATTRVQKWISRNACALKVWAAHHVDEDRIQAAVASVNGVDRRVVDPPSAMREDVPTDVLIEEANHYAHANEDDDAVEVEDFLDHLAERKRFEEAEFPQENTLELFIKSDKPVPLVFSSDWHLGSIGTDYTAFKEDIKFLFAHPEIKLITVGDLIDNFVKFKSAEAVLQQVCNPRMQHKLLYKIAARLAKTKQFLAATWGNHDTERDEHIIGESALAQMLAAVAHFFDGRGLIILKVGPTIEEAMTYTILLTHAPPGSSANDKNHGGKRLYREHFPADVTVTAHRHTAAMQQDSYYDVARDAGFNFGGPRVTIATGTYKTKDAYSRRYWSEGRVGAHTVLFWPKVRRMTAFVSAEDAITYIKGLEGVKECRCSTPNQCGSKPREDAKKPKSPTRKPTRVKQERQRSEPLRSPSKKVKRTSRK